MKKNTGIVIFFVLFCVDLAFAVPKTLNFQGRIVKSDGAPLEYGNVSFLFQITNPSGSCVVYEEQIDGFSMANSNGIFDIPIGEGTKIFPTSPTATVIDSFSNGSIMPCKGSLTYTPGVDDGRRLRMHFHDGVGWKTVSPDNFIRTVPYAGYAASAAKVGGYAPDAFVVKTGIPNCVATGTFLTWDGISLTCAAPSGGSTVTNSATLANANIWIGDIAGKAQALLMSGDATLSNVGVLTLNTVPISKGGTGATTQVGALNALLPSQGTNAGKILKTDGTNATWENAPASGGVTSVDVAVPTYMNTSGGAVTSSGVITLGFDSQAQNLVFSSPVSGAGAPSFRGLQISDIHSSAGGAFLTGADCSAGQALVYTAANDTISCQAITISASGSAGGDLSGNYPNPTVATGAIGNTKLAADAVTSDKILDGTIATNDLANVAVTDAKIANVAVSKVASGPGHYFTYAPNNTVCNPGQILKWQNLHWECGDESGVGSESDPTVEAFSKNTPSADFSTPANVLTLNTVPITKGGTGATTQAGAINALLPIQGSQTGKVLQTDGTNVSWVAPTTPDLSGYVAKTGDTMSGALNLPGNGLAVGTNQLVVNSGRVGIGNASPTTALDVTGTITSGKLNIGGSGTEDIYVLGNAQARMNLRTNFTGAAAESMITLERARGGGAAVGPGDGLGAIYFSGRHSSGTGIGALIKSETTGASGTSIPGNLLFFTSATTPQERVRITEAGDVGIGMTNPTEKLEVDGKVKATEFCIAGSCLSSWPAAGGSGTVTQVTTGTGLTGGPITTTGAISIASGGVSATELASNAVTTVKILDNNVTSAKLETVSGLVAGAYGTATKIPAVTVDNKGRVTAISTNDLNVKIADIKNGLGTAAFSVAGCLANQTVNWSSLLDTFTCQNIGSLDADKITAGTIANARLPASAKMWQDGGSNNIYYNLGSVGIGTNNPQEKFDVKGTNRTWIRSVSTAATTDENMGFQAVNYMNGRINSPTFWGVNYRGTEAAPAALQSGDMLFSLGGSGGRDNAWNVNQGAYVQVVATENFTSTAGGSKMIFYTAANGTNTTQPRMTVDHSGNVGIGTANPTQKLSVAGVIESTSGGVKFPDGTTQTTATLGPVGFMAWGAGTTIPNTSLTKAINPTVAWDKTGAYNSTTGVFTVPSPGVYSCTCQIDFEAMGGTAAAPVDFFAALDSTGAVGHGGTGGNRNRCSWSACTSAASSHLYFSGAGSVSCMAYQGSGSSKALAAGDDRNFFSCYRMGP